ncbi:MAG: ferredoxin family protein [Deltaproteobacteria bacterium]|nr:ferredoxin family protein [Deltaproteobacteria bacterium]
MNEETLRSRYWNLDQCTIPVGKVTILTDFCKGGDDCDDCIRFCPEHVLERGTEKNERGFYPPVLVEDAKCTVCGRCQLYCSENAIFVNKVGERMVSDDEVVPREEK